MASLRWNALDKDQPSPASLMGRIGATVKGHLGEARPDFLSVHELLLLRVTSGKMERYFGFNRSLEYGKEIFGDFLK